MFFFIGEIPLSAKFSLFCSLFTLDKSQCRGVDLQQQATPTNPYEEQSGILLKGDNLGRMLALRSSANMSHIERLADEMITYGLVRFGKIFIFLQLNLYAVSVQMNVIENLNAVAQGNSVMMIIINMFSVILID